MWSTLRRTGGDRRKQNTFDGGINNSNDSLQLKDNQSQSESGWDTDKFPALHSRKGRTPYGSAGGAPTNLLTNFGTSQMVRSVGTVLQYDTGTGSWNSITGTFTATDWDATNFEVSAAPALVLTNGTDNVKVWTGSALSDLSADAPKGTLITNDTIRLWIAKGAVLYFSAFEAPSDWTTAENSGSVEYYTPNGGDITGLRNFYGDKYLWKKDSLAVVQGTNYFNFRLREISNNIGCVSFKTIQEVGDTLYWLGQNDIYAFKGGVPTPIGERVRAFLNDLNASQISRCFGMTDGIRYFLGICTGGNAIPDTLLMYDPRHDIWRVNKINDNLRYATQFNNVTYAGDQLGQTYKMFQGQSDNGAAVSWSITSRDFDEGQVEAEKEYWELHVQMLAPTGTTFTVEVSTDQGQTYTAVGDAITTGPIAQNTNIIVPLDAVPISNWAQFRLRGTGEVVIYQMQRMFRLHPVQY